MSNRKIYYINEELDYQLCARDTATPVAMTCFSIIKKVIFT